MAGEISFVFHTIFAMNESCMSIYYTLQRPLAVFWVLELVSVSSAS